MIDFTSNIFKRSGALYCLMAIVCLIFVCAAQDTSAQKSKKSVKGKKVVKQQAKPKKKGRSKAQSSTQSAQKELLKVRSEIKATRSQINSLSKKESSTLQKLALHEKHSSQLVRHIDLLENNVAVLKDSINIARRNEQMLLTRLQQIQQSYAKITQEFYKAGKISSDELIATGRSSDTEIRRTAYMKALTQRLNEQVHQMAEVKDSIERQQQLLKTHTEEQNKALKTKSAEQNELERSITQKKKALDEIRSNKELLRQELAKKEQSARHIGSMINRLIAEETQKREARKKEIARRKAALKKKRADKLADRKSRKKTSSEKPGKGGSPDLASKDISVGKIDTERPDYTRSSFKQNSLAWPVGSRRILRGFGQYRNPSTNTITDNPGIDISASRGSGVQSVSGGVVSLLHWLPGYGSLVIVDHENGFRSVYANLASVAVREGQQVSAGSLIGRSGESVDGEFVHFELWRERQKLNPVSWLR